jgi:GNAT superfamily N-acetyltransferase
MSASTRAARPSDTGLILDFIRELSVYEKLAHEVDADEASIGEALFGAAPRAFCDIAEWRGEPAGFALWFYNFSTFRGKFGLYLEDLFVREAFRGNGLGKALLRRLAQRCIDEDLPRLQWWVLDWNAPAIAFYRSLGAEPMDGWTVFRVSGAALTRLARG